MTVADSGTTAKTEDPAKTTTTTTTTADAGAADYSTDEGIAKLPAEAQKYIKELRGEGMSKKEAIKTEKAARAEAERERDELKASIQKATDDAEKKRLQEEGKWKELAEKNEQKLNDTIKEHQSRTLKAEVKAAAQAAGIINPLVADLIPRDKISFNDQGDAQGVTEAIEIFKAANPNLFAAAAAATTTPPAPTVNATGTGAGNPNPGVAGSAAKAVSEMTNAEYEKYKTEKLKA